MGRASRRKRDRGVVTGGPATIERGRRCQNCRHYDSGELAVKHYKERRFGEMQTAAKKVLDGEGVSAALLGQRLGDSDAQKAARRVRDLSTLDSDAATKLGLNYELGDTLLRNGQMGICLIGAAPSDFVHFAYLCDQWSEKYKPDESDKPDELGDEARERLGLDK